MTATAQSALAQDVGIQFGAMPVGTTLITEVISARPYRISEKFLGRRDDFFVTEVNRSKRGGDWEYASTSYYDLKGRLVRRNRKKGFEAYEPYACDYSLGRCKHVYQYPNPLKGHKQTFNTRQYSTRLERQTLIVSWKLVNGANAEIPYKLGPYNLRVSSEYKNRLGQDRGHKLIELIVPEARTETTAPPPLAQRTAAGAAESRPDYCTVLYERLSGEAPGDIGKCTPTVKPARLRQCTLPSDGNSDRLPSQVVLILDASGSMAGRIKREQKMSVAKREAKHFLSKLAKDVPVGMIAYGHVGSNKPKDKELSCAGIDWAVPVGANRRAVTVGIDALQPTGWTPMADALTFAGGEINVPAPDEHGETATPVIYLISDGKETCDGDPVAAAAALHASGSKALVHVIGFDIDSETREQLEAISQAGGGRFFLAQDSAALAAHLRAAADAVNSRARFEYCINENQGLAETVYNSARNSVPACFVRESERKTRDFILDKVKAFATPEDQACAKTVTQMAREQWLENISKMREIYSELGEAQRDAGQQARLRSKSQAREAR